MALLSVPSSVVKSKTPAEPPKKSFPLGQSLVRQYGIHVTRFVQLDLNDRRFTGSGLRLRERLGFG